MSKISLEGNSLGTGTFTIASPNSNTSRSITLPDAAGAVVLDTATQTLTNKTINASQLVDASITPAKLNGAQSGNAPIYAARAWVNFNGSGSFTPNPSTSVIRGSGNVSSITRNGTGDYTINFSTAMPDANFAVAGSVKRQNTTTVTSSNNNAFSPNSYTTTSVRIICFEGSGNLNDMENSNIWIIR